MDKDFIDPMLKLTSYSAVCIYSKKNKAHFNVQISKIIIQYIVLKWASLHYEYFSFLYFRYNLM